MQGANSGTGSSNFWGSLIVTLRREQGVSQRKLAVGAKVNRSTLRRIEEGTARGDIDIMERLLSYLGYELEAIATGSPSERMKKHADEVSNPSARSKMAMTRLLNMTLG